MYNYPFNGSLQTGLADDVYAGPANAALKWETTSAYNAGIDLGLFNSRLVLHADVYLKRTNNLLQYIIPKDIKDFGLIPEIIGRLPVLTHMDPLDRDALRAILTEPKNALIKQYKKLFEIDGVTFEITDEALNFIVDKALEYKLGARGLRSLCEAILTDAMYELPGSDNKELIIDLDYAQDALNKNLLKRLRNAS